MQPDNDIRFCYRCGFETDSPESKCPQCGRFMRRVKTIRRLGWLLLVIGAFLVVFMGVITIIVAGIVYHSNDPEATSGFTGGPEVATLIFGLFAFVLLFGLASMVSGGWQIKYGRPNKKLIRISLGLGFIFIVIGEAVRYLK